MKSVRLVRSSFCESLLDLKWLATLFATLSGVAVCSIVAFDTCLAHDYSIRESDEGNTGQVGFDDARAMKACGLVVLDARISSSTSTYKTSATQAK